MDLHVFRFYTPPQSLQYLVGDGKLYGVMWQDQANLWHGAFSTTPLQQAFAEAKDELVFEAIGTRIADARSKRRRTTSKLQTAAELGGCRHEL